MPVGRETAGRSKESLADKFTFVGLPKRKDLVFRHFLGNSERILSNFKGTQEERVSDPRGLDAPSYVSFGDRGTTASVNAHGDLLQISRHLGVGRSGFLVVDLATTPEPCYIHDRAEKLREQYESTEIVSGCLFSFDSAILDRNPELVRVCEQPRRLEFIRDRWPQFTTTSTKYLHLTKQLWASDGTVFERMTFESVKGPTPILSKELTAVFDPRMLRIRTLDFMDDWGSFNFDDFNENYAEFLGPHGNSLIVVHEGSIRDIHEAHEARGAQDVRDACEVDKADEADGIHTIGLVIAICVNGQVREVESVFFDNRQMYQIKLEEEEVIFAKPERPLELTMGYRLQTMPHEIDWKKGLISASDFTDMDQEFEPSSFRQLKFSSDLLLDFLMRRNLEHILSVCSIPVQSSCNTEEQRPGGEAVNPRSEVRNSIRELPSIALTCGDMSGHRLVTSASFFAFQFLLSMYKFLGRYPPRLSAEQSSLSSEDREAHVSVSRALRRRIELTCRGHAAWVQRARRIDSGFEANYWPSGEIIRTEQYQQELSSSSLTDSPFQTIKLAEFGVMFGADKAFVRDIWLNIVRPWISKLDEMNTRNFYAFPRPGSQDLAVTKGYRLEDHVWIWRTLRSVADLGLGKQLKKSTTSQDLSRDTTASNSRGGDPLPPTGLPRDYTPAEFQRPVLKRFTTINNISRNRMLAVGRSATSDRFMFRSRDTALFYEENVPFFNKSETLWGATIDVQQLHEEMQDSGWNNPLRYALALMIASRGSRVNTRSPESMADTATKILFETATGSGLFPGQLNSETKEPELFRDDSSRDFFWHVSFEVPYILWRYGHSVKNERDVTTHRKAYHDAPKSEHKHGSKNVKMKRHVAVNALIGNKNIVEVSDEWLYNQPDFLEFQPTMNVAENDISKASYIAQALNEALSGEARADVMVRAVVKDVTKSTQIKNGKGRKNQTQEHKTDAIALTNAGLYEKFKEGRTTQNAKKRIIWSCNANPTMGLWCYLASTESEREFISSFFDRHDQKRKYFYDEATATANKWITEFHLSSYQLLRKDDSLRRDDLKFLGSPKAIRRAGTGFRFVGDFFDRYWTCHILQTEPKEDMKRKEMYKSDGNHQMATRFLNLIESPKRLHEHELQKKPWRQRKVLELLLFDRMLKRIRRRYDEIFEEMRNQLLDLFPHIRDAVTDRADVLLVASALFSSRLSTDTYMTFSKRWPAFQYTLQVMEEDLKETRETIELWQHREKDRQWEKPRWTRNDESRYRGAIHKLTISNNQGIRELDHCLTKLQSLKTSFDSRLESTRDELNFQSADDVRMFTYVTIFFLPLGFATSVFSMNGAPEGWMWHGMAVTAVISLVLTFLVLTHLHILEKYAFRPVGLAVKHPRKANQLLRAWRERKAASAPGNTRPAPPLTNQDDLMLGHGSSGGFRAWRRLRKVFGFGKETGKNEESSVEEGQAERS